MICHQLPRVTEKTGKKYWYRFRREGTNPIAMGQPDRSPWSHQRLETLSFKGTERYSRQLSPRPSRKDS
jgi:hypothetical protein